MKTNDLPGAAAPGIPAGPTPAALRRHLDYLVQETRRFPCGEVRHFLGCALLALEDHFGVGARPVAFPNGELGGHA